MKNIFYVFCLLGFVFTSCSEKSDKETLVKVSEPLPSWENVAIKEKIITFVKNATDSLSSGFISPEDRIAVFDNDGTLWPEQPYPNQLQYAIDYVKAHSDSIDLPTELKAATLSKNIKALGGFGEQGLLQIANATHANVSAKQFAKNVKQWADTAQSPKFKQLYTKAVYKPMLELLDFLRENDFKTFIVSGGGADFMRAFAYDVYGVPSYQVVGTYSESVYDKTTGEIIKTAKILLVDDKEGKLIGIHTFIGKQPVICFGNSDGDLAMMEYTSKNKLPNLCGIIHHTDAEREFAYDTVTLSGHLEDALKEAETKNWIVVDMKNDWGKVFDFEKE